MLLRTQQILFKLFKRNVTALYVPAEKATKNVAVLVPHTEFAKRLDNRRLLVQNYTRRKFDKLHLGDIYLQWEFVNTLANKEYTMVERRNEVKMLTAKVKTMDDSVEKENLLRKYSIESECLREDLQTLRVHKQSVLETFTNDFLEIPNDLHPKTPDEPKEMVTYLEKTTEPSNFHLEYEDYIDYYNESVFYLKQKAARFDLRFPLYCIDRFKAHKFIHFSNPDFAKTVLVEGATIPMNEVYMVGDEEDVKCTNLTHLVGNGSLLSYLGYFSKLIVPLTQMPFRSVSTGKQYQVCEPNESGLYQTCQSTCVQVFAAGTELQMEEIFESTLLQSIDIFKELNLHFRVVYVPAHELRAAECLRARIEMYSPHFRKYIEVGNLSNFSNFISKRLLFNYPKDGVTGFPHIVAGTMCNVTNLIAIILENNQGKFSLPKEMEHI